ncbi:MAG: hypothetical protein HY336_00995 [Candidatus Doudnabacteria bacterium]|nr:hypothetical protein [Candidatus Doudnabacteria bacterium]
MSRKWERKVGKAFLDRLDEVILEIGKDTFTRRQLIDDLHCGNMSAAANLDWVLKRFEPRSIKELAARVDIEDLFSIKGVGEATVYVWMCAVEHAGRNPEEWLDREVKLTTLYANRKNRRCREE